MQPDMWKGTREEEEEIIIIIIILGNGMSRYRKREYGYVPLSKEA